MHCIQRGVHLCILVPLALGVNGCDLLFYGLLGWEGGRLVFGKGVLAWTLVDGKGGYTGWWARVAAIARAKSMKFLQLCDNFMCMMVIDEAWMCRFSPLTIRFCRTYRNRGN